jgi:molecular chaperone DnaK
MSAPYYLAVDVGTSRTSAAIARIAPDGSPLASAFPLGRSSDNAPTVAFVSDGEVLFGDAAERRGSSQPDRLIREYKRRIGDDVPILAGDRAFAPEELYALTVDWAARAVVEREGSAPVRLAITVPASWGEHRSSIVRAALSVQGWRDIDIITEPEAAARHYESTNPLESGRVLAVYDFGGGTFDAVLLRKAADGAVAILGTPTGIADLGGADFDDTVVRHIISAAKVDATSLAGDTAGRLALAALRRECVEAKESLSFDSEAVVPVILSGDQRTVRLTRDEFELMIADDLERTVMALEDALSEAAVSLDDVDAILLTGGSSRIPRVAQLLSERFDRPIAIDADPKAIIALGAARASVDTVVAAQQAAEAADAEVDDDEDDDDDLAALTAGAEVPRRRSWFRKVPPTAYVAGAFAILLAGTGIVAAPALGSGALDPEQARMTGAPAALGSQMYGPPLPVEEVAAVEPAAEAAPAEQVAEQPAPRTNQANNPRNRSRTPASESSPRQSASPKAQSSAPPSSGGSAPAANNNGGGSSNPAPQPSNSTSQPAPQPSNSTSEPAPQPSNSTSEPAPQPSTSEPAPQPSTSEPAPQPSTSEPAPQPSTSEPAPQPSTPDPAPEPTASTSVAPTDPAVPA